jgi:hypothetical protein
MGPIDRSEGTPIAGNGSRGFGKNCGDRNGGMRFASCDPKKRVRAAIAGPAALSNGKSSPCLSAMPSTKSTHSNPLAGPTAKFSRRGFLRKSVSAALATPLLMSLEETALMGAAPAPGMPGAKPVDPANRVPSGKIGKFEVGRLICGGNLISGYAHSRDLIYVSSLLKHYFTEEKIFDTWARCEEYGINTMVASSSDSRVNRLYQGYVKRGGKIQYIAQVNPQPQDLNTSIRLAAEAGAVGAFLLGNLGDKWVREGAVGRVGEVVEIIKEQGLVAGVAGHEVRTPKAVDKAKIDVDFYVKTLHQDNYWSKRRPEQTAEVIDNYKTDNYWCRDCEETVDFFARVKKPWIAYKVLAAGAIPVREGFRYAFESGADFALVGMFDFQVDVDASITRQVLASKLKRARAWVA